MRSKALNWATSLLQPAAFLLMFAPGMLLPAIAHAHAALVSSSPASNETLATPAGAVRLQFNEPVRVIRAAARDAGGVSQNLTADTSGATVTLYLQDPIEHGSVIVSYRVESEDGHPIGGSLVFHVGAPSSSTTAMPRSATSTLAVAIWTVHTVSILYLAIVVGGALFNRWLDPGRVAPVRTVAAVVPGAVLLLTGLYLQGLDELGVGLVYAGLEPLATAAKGNGMIAAVLALLSIVSASLPIPSNRRAARGVAVLAMCIASAAFAFTGHCNVVEPRWLARLCIMLHGAALMFWIGSLLPLWRSSKTRFNQRPLLDFSRAVPLPFGLMLVAGATLAFIELPEISQLFSSLYGRILVFKVGLVTALCVLASYNRFYLTKPALAGNQGARVRLRRSIACEMVLAIAIVGAASLWRFAGPAASTVEQPRLSVHLHSAKVMAQLELSPQPPGKANARVVVMGPDFGSLEPRSVSLRLMNPDAGVEPIKYPLAKSPEGGWQADVLSVSDPRGWKVDVEVLIDDFTSAHLEGSLLTQ